MEPLPCTPLPNERFLLRLHASHLQRGALAPLELTEAQALLKRLTSGDALSDRGTTVADDMPFLRVQGCTLQAVDNFDDFEVDLILANAEPFVVSSSEGEHDVIVLVEPASEHFLLDDDNVRQIKEMTFQSGVWLVRVSGSSASDVAVGLEALSRAGAARRDFEDNFSVADGQLGAGSNSTVFRVDKRFNGSFAETGGKHVAKLLTKPDQNCPLAKLRCKLRNEVRALVMAQHHPNVVGFSGAFLLDPAEHQWALIMQRCDGGSLFHAVLRNFFSEEKARSVMTGVFSALVHLHQTCGIAHRDVKPENVLLTETGVAVLADFGLATKLPTSGKLRWRCGTPGYLAAEMLLDDGYDTQVDVFSAGGVLFFMFCGQAPFMHGSVTQTLRATLRSKLDLSAHPRFTNVSTLCRRVITSLLRRDPASRPNAEQAMRSPWFHEDIPSVKVEPRQYEQCTSYAETADTMCASSSFTPATPPRSASCAASSRRRCRPAGRLVSDPTMGATCELSEHSELPGVPLIAGHSEPMSRSAPLAPQPPRKPRSSSASIRSSVGVLLRRLVPRPIMALTANAREVEPPAPEMSVLPVTPTAPLIVPVAPSTGAPKRSNMYRLTRSKLSITSAEPTVVAQWGPAASTKNSLLHESGSEQFSLGSQADLPVPWDSYQ